MGLDLIPRIEDHEVNENEISLVKLYRIHMENEQFSVRPRGTIALKFSTKLQKSDRKHIFMMVRSLDGLGESEEIHAFWSIFDAEASQFVQ